MTKLTLKLTTSAVSAVLGLASVAPAAFGATSLTVSGNGSNSNNSVNVSSSNSNFVTQSNVANVVNDVAVSSNTGGNHADSNTGGTSNISTGSTTSNVGVSTQANSNIANVAACNCLGNTDVTVSGNGHESDNSVDLHSNHASVVNQTNEANVLNNVSVDSNTGHNSASSNTNGDNGISTGGSNATVGVTNALNSNVVTESGSGNGGNVTVNLSGNGEASDNNADVTLGSANFLTQANDAHVVNNVSAFSNTGGNDADSNTGGNTHVSTGTANDHVTVSNAANFNGADLSNCDCVTGLDATISGNGHESDNNINFSSNENSNVLDQGNLFDGLNHVFGHSKTGWNSASSDTDGSTFLSTGGSNDTTTVSNQANSNVIGGSSMSNSSFSWSALMAWMTAHMGN